MTEQIWRVTWGLEVFKQGVPSEVLEKPDVNCFRMKFATKEEAYFFKVEMQRFLGNLMLRLSDNVKVRAALAATRPIAAKRLY